MGGCQNYGPFLGNRDPKRDPNFDNHPYKPHKVKGYLLATKNLEDPPNRRPSKNCCGVLYRSGTRFRWSLQEEYRAGPSNATNI